jgi:hypothetical protein
MQPVHNLFMNAILRLQVTFFIPLHLFMLAGIMGQYNIRRGVGGGQLQVIE